MIHIILGLWLSFIVTTFYRRIQGKNIKNLKVKGPVIIAMNHPNAFTDPTVINFLTYPIRLKYLARGDAFKPGLANWFFEQLGIVPIFRIQDGGKEGLKKNDESYKRVNQLLKRKGKVIVFAEGLCIQERRLRPLKKGVPRMVFGAYDFLKTDDLIVVPVGINYSNPSKFRSYVFYNVGEPILVKDFIDEYKQNAARANNKFLEVLEPKMKALITHINNKEYDEVVFAIEELCKKDMLTEQQLNRRNLEHDFIITQQITEKVNKANETILDEFKNKSKIYFNQLKKYQLKDWLINPNQNKFVTPLFLLLRVIALLIFSPIYLLGLLGNYLPFVFTQILTKKIVKKNKEFYSSVIIATSLVLFLVNYLLLFFISYAFSPTVFWPIGICLILALCAGFSLHYHPFLVKTMGMARILKNKSLKNSLLQSRNELLSLINKF
jgi:1-acyl-sn-glycerol-3-phosphate acyltransferase